MELNCKYVECVGDGDGAEDDGQCLDLDIHYICTSKKKILKRIYLLVVVEVICLCPCFALQLATQCFCCF